MTAIAWAIIFVGLIFFDGIFRKELEEDNDKNYRDKIASLIAFTGAMLIFCTIREWFR